MLHFDYIPINTDLTKEEESILGLCYLPKSNVGVTRPIRGSKRDRYVWKRIKSCSILKMTKVSTSHLTGVSNRTIRRRRKSCKTVDHLILKWENYLDCIDVLLLHKSIEEGCYQDTHSLLGKCNSRIEYEDQMCIIDGR